MKSIQGILWSPRIHGQWEIAVVILAKDQSVARLKCIMCCKPTLSVQCSNLRNVFQETIPEFLDVEA